jgi:hypothetical protein
MTGGPTSVEGLSLLIARLTWSPAARENAGVLRVLARAQRELESLKHSPPEPFDLPPRGGYT